METIMNDDMQYSEQQMLYESGYRPDHSTYGPAQRLEQPVYQSEHSMYGPSQQMQQPMYMPFYENRSSTAVLCYVFGWLSGLLFLLFARGDRYLRFHALQSLLFFGAVNMFDFAFLFWFHTFHGPLFIPGFMLFLGFLLLNFIAFIGWIVAMVQAGGGVYYRLPFVGDAAARAVGLDATVLK
jgi:uncharacterized membrane protein